VVLARGNLPCDILFVSESPGTTENTRGQSSIGPAGQLLDQMIAESIYAHSTGWRVAFTQLVACMPKGTPGTKAAHDITKKQIESCRPRLVEFVQIAKPQLIIRMGKLVEKFIPNQEMFTGPTKLEHQIQFVDMIHPASILRADVSQKALAYQRCVVTLSDAVEQLAPF